MMPRARESLRWSRAILIATTVLFPTPGKTGGQEKITVPDPGPASGRLIVEGLGPILQGKEPKVFRGPPGGVGRLRDGSILLSVTAVGERLYRLDPEGRMIETLPIPFSSINRIAVTPQDSVLVWDQGANELTVLSPTLQLVRRSPLPFSPASSITSPSEGLLVVMAMMYTPRHVGHPFHLVDSSGRHIRSFGEDGLFRTDRGPSHPRPISPSVHGIMAGFVDHYSIEIWALTGEHLLTVERDAPWFPGGDVTVPLRGEIPPTFLSSVHEDREGRLWTGVHVPAEGWKEADASDSKRADGEQMRRKPADLAGLWDTRIEVLDKQKTRVIASGLVPADVALFLDAGHVLGSRPVEDGWIIDLWRVKLPPTTSPGGSDDH